MHLAPTPVGDRLRNLGCQSPSEGLRSFSRSLRTAALTSRLSLFESEGWTSKGTSHVFDTICRQRTGSPGGDDRGESEDQRGGAGRFFRASTLEQAQRLGLQGSVENRPDKSVALIAQGGREKVEALLRYVHHGSDAAKVSRVEVETIEVDAARVTFRVE